MATIRIYCDCKLMEVGTATIDWYKVVGKIYDDLMNRKAECRHCYRPVKYVGEKGAITHAEADFIDSWLAPTGAEGRAT